MRGINMPLVVDFTSNSADAAGAGLPIPILPVERMRMASAILVLNINGLASAVPTKFVAGFVVLLPVSDQEVVLATAIHALPL